MESKYGSRKFIIALIALIGATTLCGFSKIDGGAYMAVVGITVGVYQVANVMGKKNETLTS